MTSHHATDQPRDHMRLVSRLLKLHHALSANRFPALDQLATLLERNSRTVQRDLHRMRDNERASPFDHVRRGGATVNRAGSAACQDKRRRLLAFFVASMPDDDGSRAGSLLLRGSRPFFPNTSSSTSRHRRSDDLPAGAARHGRGLKLNAWPAPPANAAPSPSTTTRSTQ